MADDEKPSGTFGDYSESNTDTFTNPRPNQVCQRSGFKVKAGELVQEWTGLWVLPEFRDFRHPQELRRGVPEQPRVGKRPEQRDSFLSVTEVIEDESGVAINDNQGAFLYSEGSDEVKVTDL